jgi:hypothetical protein
MHANSLQSTSRFSSTCRIECSGSQRSRVCTQDQFQPCFRCISAHISFIHSLVSSISSTTVLSERASSTSPTPYYSDNDEYDLYTQTSQPPDEQDVANEYQQTYLLDHVGFSPLPHASHA